MCSEVGKVHTSRRMAEGGKEMEGGYLCMCVYLEIPAGNLQVAGEHSNYTIDIVVDVAKSDVLVCDAFLYICFRLIRAG